MDCQSWLVTSKYLERLQEAALYFDGDSAELG